ncbi:NUDIX hydrolase [Brevibacillus borstelensis]|uniref:NUDIX hydrolase n=1 Tax=Brevibacillus borstelensis TaxID=45462 RepID=UPI0030C04B9C
MKEETLDIFDENRQWIGTEARSEVHRLGLWHQTFHCWIYRKEGERVYLLFQKRHPRKDTSPGKLDITSAGHLLAGEGPGDGVRELEEELGLAVSFESLQRIGVIRDASSEPGIVDREICHVYGYESDQPLEAYRIQREELTGLLWIRLDELMRLIDGETSAVRASGFVCDEDGSVSGVSEEVGMADLVAHERHYYQTVFEAVRELAGKS